MPDSPSSAYRWHRPEHPDLLFWGIEPPLPWPAEDDGTMKPGVDFPFHKLLTGIERLRAAGTEWDGKWDKVKAFLERGGELGDALEAGNMPETVRILEELEALRPGTAYCPFNKAFALRTMGDTAGALAAAALATGRAPMIEHLWMRRGDLHEELGQNDAAIRCFQEALRLLPNHQQAVEGLVRLGAMVGLTLIMPDGTRRMRFFSHKEFHEEMAAQIAKDEPGSPQLRSLMQQFLDKKDGAAALMAIDRILEGEPEDVLALKVKRADALRMLKRYEEAQALLNEVLEEDDKLAEGYYVLAWCHFDQGENAAGWAGIKVTLECDPNHQKAIQTQFGAGSSKQDPERIKKLTKWAAENHSWRGHWVASIEASTNRNLEAALRCAEAAYKLAPEEREALFLYANCLNNMGEGEYTAALVHPRLPEAKGDYTLKYIFAGAMKRLGLKDAAVRVLRESLEEAADMPAKWRENTQYFLDELNGLVAASEINPEFHPNTHTLRREVWGGGEEGPDVPLLQSGVGLPVKRAIRMTPRPGYTGSTGSLGMYHHGRQSEMEPTSLGWFQAHEIDFSDKEAPMMTVTVTERRKLEASARQGERRLPVTWSLFRAPSMENDPSLGGGNG